MTETAQLFAINMKGLGLGMSDAAADKKNGISRKIHAPPGTAKLLEKEIHRRKTKDQGRQQ